ncbi:MAG: ComF family protein [Chitinophagaceae bacterium]
MLKTVQSYFNDFAHLFFPHNCLGCGFDALDQDQFLCIKCFSQLPETNFFLHPQNIIEKIFYGRINVEHAGSAFYFTKNSLLQNLLIELKYKNNKEIGFYLGKIVGSQIKESNRFNEIDIIIPLPLNGKKQRKRSYNQSEIIANGIASVLEKPIVNNAIIRTIFTETQTHKTRISRWQTMEGVFKVMKPELLKEKNILLVDDIITTGATLEACGTAILQISSTKLSIATVAYTI